VHGVVRWRRVDLQQIVAERFGVAYHERTVGKILKQLGFSYVSARPRHPAKDEETVAAFKNVCPAPSASGFERGDLTGLRQRIRSRGRAPAKMEFRAPLVLIRLTASSAIF
jgi:Winged helix-turn helix